MRQLTSLDAQFLNVETPTTTGHVGSLVVLDPSTAPGGVWNLESVRAVLEPRLHLAAPFRERLVELPLGLGRPYWTDDPHFDIEFHLRELALPGPGTDAQLGEQVARIHSRPLDRTRPLWEAYVITGLEGGRTAFYTKVHHSAIDGVSGAEILETLMDLTPEPREVEPEDETRPGRCPRRSGWPPAAWSRWRATRWSWPGSCPSRWPTSTSSRGPRTSRACTCSARPPGRSAGCSASAAEGCRAGT